MGHNNTIIVPSQKMNGFGCRRCGKYLYDVSESKVKLMKKLHVKVCKLVDVETSKFTINDFDGLVQEGRKEYKNKFNIHYRINEL